MFVVLTDGFKVYTIGLQSALDRNYVKKKNCFHFSVKDLINFVKNSKDNYGTYVGLVNLRAIFPVKKVLCNTRDFFCINDTSVNTYENRKCSHLSEIPK